MANPKHMEAIARGGGFWEDWRHERPNEIPDLAVADLKGANLRSYDLSKADLQRANLRGIDFTEADLVRADLRGADLREALLVGTELREANLDGALLTGSDLTNANLRGAHAQRTDFREANGRGAQFWEAKLRGANLREAYLRGARLREADLSEADLWGANLSGVDLRGGNLRGATIAGADFSQADLRGADLSKTQAAYANFSGATLTGVCIAEMQIDDTTNLDEILCDYVYLDVDRRERRPLAGNFGPGDFARLFFKQGETVELLFREGIDWRSFLDTLEGLRQEHETETGETQTRFEIDALEAKPDGLLVVRVTLPWHWEPTAIAEAFEERYAQAWEAQVQKYFPDVEREILDEHLREGADLLALIELKANQ